MKESSSRSFPSDTEKNLKDCMASTLQSGKELGDGKELGNSEKVENDKIVNEDIDNKKVKNEKVETKKQEVQMDKKEEKKKEKRKQVYTGKSSISWQTLPNCPTFSLSTKI